MLFRKLAPGEGESYAAHLSRLDAADRRMRFCAGIADEAIGAFCADIDWPRTTVLGCFADGELRGAAQLWRARTGLAGVAELGLSVERPFQDRGLGTELLRRALVVARNRMVGTLVTVCLPENAKMRHIAAKLGARLSFQDGTVEGCIRPPWPSTLSVAEEVAADGQALVRAVFATATAAAQCSAPISRAPHRWPARIQPR